jgi:hypothetical protein
MFDIGLYALYIPFTFDGSFEVVPGEAIVLRRLKKSSIIKKFGNKIFYIDRQLDFEYECWSSDESRRSLKTK